MISTHPLSTVLFPKLFNYPLKDFAQTQLQLLCWNNFSPVKNYKLEGKAWFLLYFICTSPLLPSLTRPWLILLGAHPGPRAWRTESWVPTTPDGTSIMVCHPRIAHAQKCPVFGLRICCYQLKILYNVWAGGMHFHSALGPASHVPARGNTLVQYVAARRPCSTACLRCHRSYRVWPDPENIPPPKESYFRKASQLEPTFKGPGQQWEEEEVCLGRKM